MLKLIQDVNLAAYLLARGYKQAEPPRYQQGQIFFVFDDSKGEITAAKCMGCGICASECPACAIQLNHFETRQFNAMLEELLEHHLTVETVSEDR